MNIEMVNKALKELIDERIAELRGRQEHPDCTVTARAIIAVRIDELENLVARWRLSDD